MRDLLFKHKSTVKVDMADLDNEKENLAIFLRNQFNLNTSIAPKGLELNGEVTSCSAAIMVKKFLHRKNLDSTHWVTIENDVVKISKFKGTNKKKEKHKKSMPHQNITQSWGL